VNKIHHRDTEATEKSDIFVFVGSYRQIQNPQVLRGNAYLLNRRRIIWPTNAEDIPEGTELFHPVVVSRPDENTFLRDLCVSVVNNLFRT